MLDRAEFPRDKPCGGVVTVRAAELLPFDISPVVERVVSGIHLTVRQSHGLTRRSSQDLVYLTQRRHLDTFLVDRALDAGATLRQRSQVKEVERLRSHIDVRTVDETFSGSNLVVADGANGRTAKLADIDVKFWHHIALEGNITPRGGVPQMWQDAIGLDVGGIAGGYGWIFPKGDHLNIGLGGWRHAGPTLRERLDRLVRYYGFDTSEVWGLRGHYLPLRKPGSPLADGNVLLVGDAAGLVDPMSDEGIHSAIWSGRSAAHHLSRYVGGEAPDLSGYRRELERELIPNLSVSRQFHDLFHLSPALCIVIDRQTSIVWKLVCRLLRGEQTYSEVMRKHPALATLIELFSDLVRVTPLLQRAAGLRDPKPPERFFRRLAQNPTPHL
jgi:geranylgeranyl reductase family protein